MASGGILLSRRGLLAIADLELEQVRRKREGKVAVFTAAPSWLLAPELPDTIRMTLTAERETLGTYVTGHPIEHLDLKAPNSSQFVSRRGAGELDEEGEYVEGDYLTPTKTWVELAGVITDVPPKNKRKKTKSGNLMLFFGVEDLEGVARCLAFGETAEGVENGWVVRLRGVIEDRESDRIVKVNRLQKLERW